MPLKNSYITVTDQFCGAGGSSQGATSAGAEVKLALNHWKLAIETHNTNFPNTAHDCTDISACDPRRYNSTDILITSPECTNHSLAKGQKQVQKQIDLFNSGKQDAAAERSRATMWDVCRFAEYHNYNAIVVENVVDARKWVMFDAWLNAMYALGYQHKCVYLNSQHCFPTPQSRDRMYIVFWKKGNKAPMLDYMPLAHCPKCGSNVNAVQTWKNPLKKYGKYKQQYVYCCPVDGTVVDPYYYASFNCIDWSDRGERIGDRKKPLSDNSKRRVKTGLSKYNEPFIFHTSYGKEARGVVRSAETTFPSQAIINPFIINDQHSTGIDFRVKNVTEQLPLKIVLPFIIKGEHVKSEDNSFVRSVAVTITTQTTRQTMALVSPPFITENKGQSNARDIASPLACVTGKSYHSLITNDSWNSFIAHYYGGSDCLKHITDTTGTVTTVEGMALCNYTKPQYEDCYYRMLKPDEIKLAMAFDKDYKVLGSGKDKVKQLGNAVTPPAMEWLIKRVIESLN
jgi:DNA (cytosine-5)-methyltransferase 1